MLHHLSELEGRAALRIIKVRSPILVHRQFGIIIVRLSDHHARIFIAFPRHQLIGGKFPSNVTVKSDARRWFAMPESAFLILVKDVTWLRERRGQIMMRFLRERRAFYIYTDLGQANVGLAVISPDADCDNDDADARA